jgi:hypothetical protein
MKPLGPGVRMRLLASDVLVARNLARKLRMEHGNSTIEALQARSVERVLLVLNTSVDVIDRLLLALEDAACPECDASPGDHEASCELASLLRAYDETTGPPREPTAPAHDAAPPRFATHYAVRARQRGGASS